MYELLNNWMIEIVICPLIDGGADGVSRLNASAKAFVRNKLLVRTIVA